MSQQNNKQNLPTTSSNLSSVNIQDYSQNNQVQQSLQNQHRQQQRTQMQQAPQGSPVPMNTIAQQSPQHQMQQQSVQSPSQQQQPAQTSLQQQPSIQPSSQQQSSLSPNIAAGTVGAGRGVAAVRGGAKKKGATTTRKASTGGGRAKATPFEKSNSEDSMLPQALNRMAADFYTQAQQLGVETVEGQKMYKKYEDTVRAIQQVNLNNQTATSYNLSMTQDQTPSSLTSTSSPHTVTRSIVATTTMSSVAPQLSAQRPQQLQQSIQQQQQAQQHHLQNRPSRTLFPQDYQQLLAEMNRVQETLSQPNIAPTMKQEYESRLHMLKATIAGAKFQASPGTTNLGTHMPPQSPRGFMSPQVVRSSIQANMNTLGQNRTQAGNDLNRTSSQQISSPILPSTSMATGQLQDVSMMSITSTSNMQHQLGQQAMLSPRLQQVPQSPSTQPPQSTLIHQQLQQQSVGSNEDMMDIDAEPGTIIAQKTAELLATSSVVTATPRQVPPIAPAINTNVLPSTLLNNQAAGKVPTGKTPANIFGSNASFPETPASTVMDVDMEDAGTRHLLPKRKVQQLVNQIDPKERLEPEVEEMLLEIADEFISSVASFACLLAKHRKSDTLEVKDLQLHLERNWNIRIPGFASDEIRSVRKPVVSTSHQQKLAAVVQAKANKVISPSS